MYAAALWQSSAYLYSELENGYPDAWSTMHLIIDIASLKGLEGRHLSQEKFEHLKVTQTWHILNFGVPCFLSISVKKKNMFFFSTW